MQQWTIMIESMFATQDSEVKVMLVQLVVHKWVQQSSVWDA